MNSPKKCLVPTCDLFKALDGTDVSKDMFRSMYEFIITLAVLGLDFVLKYSSSVATLSLDTKANIRDTALSPGCNA